MMDFCHSPAREENPLATYIAAIDQGTTSTRAMVFDHSGREVGRHQLEHDQILPQAGWVEHNPIEIWERTWSVLMTVMSKLRLSAGDLAALGITNQRETAVVWDRRTGRPYHNAIVWQDTRTDRIAAALDRDGRGDVIRRRPDCRRRPTSLAARSPGSWTTSTACGRLPNAATRSSAPPTAG